MSYQLHYSGARDKGCEPIPFKEKEKADAVCAKFNAAIDDPSQENYWFVNEDMTYDHYRSLYPTWNVYVTLVAGTLHYTAKLRYVSSLQRGPFLASYPGDLFPDIEDEDRPPAETSVTICLSSPDKDDAIAQSIEYVAHMDLEHELKRMLTAG